MGYDTLQSPVGIFLMKYIRNLEFVPWNFSSAYLWEGEPDSEVSESNPWVSFANPRAINSTTFNKFS